MIVRSTGLKFHQTHCVSGIQMLCLALTPTATTAAPSHRGIQKPGRPRLTLQPPLTAPKQTARSSVVCHSSARMQHHALKLPAADVLQRLVKVLLARLDGARLLLVPRQVRVYQLNQPIEVLCRHLRRPPPSAKKGPPGNSSARAHRFVLLVKVVDVSVQDLDKELDGGRRFHA